MDGEGTVPLNSRNPKCKFTFLSLSSVGLKGRLFGDQQKEDEIEMRGGLGSQLRPLGPTASPVTDTFWTGIPANVNVPPT